MPRDRDSLLAGRNPAPLSDEQVRRAINIFLGLDRTVNVRHDPAHRTVFHVARDEHGEEFGEVVFGPDLYPGTGVVDPNSALSVDAAAAHELTHYHRWRNMNELNDEGLAELDEALTSLGAILRYSGNLNQTDILQLVSDAMQRLQLYVRDLQARARAAREG